MSDNQRLRICHIDRRDEEERERRTRSERDVKNFQG